MLKSLHIENFKRFRSLDVPSLKRVNLIAGRNNVGKTALLEAIALLLDGPQQLLALPKAFRNAEHVGNAKQNFWRWLFREAKPAYFSGKVEPYPDYTIRLEQGRRQNISGFSPLAGNQEIHLYVKHLRSAAGSVLPIPNQQHSVLTISVQQSNPQADAVEYDRVVLKKGAEDRLEKLLRTVEPRLQSLRSISTQGAPLVYADIGLEERIPAVHLGQGFNRLLSIYAGILASGKNVLLVDEIENGLHHEILPEVWRGIRALAESESVQVFATTHSWEAVSAAHEAFAETLDYDFALHRLVQVGEDVQVQTLDREGIEASVTGLIEVR
jgi:energy-coupling factor transporter ATP-binding protein EcfA2